MSGDPPFSEDEKTMFELDVFIPEEEVRNTTPGSKTMRMWPVTLIDGGITEYRLRPKLLIRPLMLERLVG